MRLLDIIRNLDRDRYRSFVLLPCPGPLADTLKALGVTTLFLDFKFKISRNPISRFIRLTRDFLRLAKQHKIDLIHVNLHFQMSNFWLAFLILHKPVIVHLRSHYWIHVFEKFVICRATKVICISKAVESTFLQKRRSGIIMCLRPTQTVVIYDGIDVENFKPKPVKGEFRNELKIGSQEFCVGLIGALNEVKGQDLFIRAASIVIQNHPQTRFLIIGDVYEDNRQGQEYRQLLRELIKELGLEERVVMTGFRKDVDSVMSAIDLLVQPSAREALGTSMVETMSCAKPVIGTAVDGIPEVIGDNEAGLLLKQRNPEELAEAILYFIENPEEARRMGQQGRARVLKLFDASKNTKRIEEIYQEALSRS